MKINKRYISGFRDAYNNPSQYSTFDVSRVKGKNSKDGLILGIIDGLIAKEGDRLKGKICILWSEIDLLKKIKEVKMQNPTKEYS